MIVVKVGTTSKINFNSRVKAYRAITLDDLIYLSQNKNNKILIIEKVFSSENESGALTEFLTKFREEDEKRIVIFYITDIEDEETIGIADELGFDVCFDQDELNKLILDRTGINVSAYLKDKIADSTNNAVADLFGEDTEALGGFSTVETSKVTGEQTQQATLEAQTTSEQAIENPTEAPVENKDTQTNDSLNTPEYADDEYIKTGEEIEQSVGSYDMSSDYEEDNEENNNVTTTTISHEEIDKLQKGYNTLKEKYHSAVGVIQSANDRIDQLTKLVAAIKAEKDDIKKAFASLTSNNEVIEDPISLSEYQGIVEKLEQRESSLSEKETTINELKSSLETSKKTVTSHLNKINELTSTIGTLEKQLDEVNGQIDNGEIHKGIIETFSKQIEELNAEKAKIEAVLNEQTDKSRKDENVISLLNKNIKLETEYRYATIKLFMSTIDKFSESEEQRKSIEEKLADTEEKLTKANSLIENGTKSSSEKDEIISARDLTIAEMTKTLSEKEKSLADKDKTIGEKDETIEGLKTTISEKDDEISNQSSEIVSKTRQIESLEQQVKEKDNTIEEKDETIGSKDKEITKKANELKEKDSTISEKDKDIEAKDKEITRLNGEIERISGELEESNNSLSNSTQTVSDKDRKISELEAEVKLTKSQFEKSKAEIANKDKTITERDNTIKDKESEIKDKEAEIKRLNNSIEVIQSDSESKLSEQLLELTSKLEEQKRDFIAKMNEAGTANLEKLRKQKDGFDAILKQKENTLKDEISEKNKELIAKDGIIADKDKTIAKQKDEIEEQKAQVTNINTKVTELTGQLSEKDKVIEEVKNKLKESEAKFRKALENLGLSDSSSSGTSSSDSLRIQELEFELANAKRELEEAKLTLVPSISSEDVAELNNLRTENKKLTSLNTKLVERNSALEEESQSIQELLKQIEELSTERDNLKSRLTTSSSGGSSIEPINYTGQAQIISVVGCGSFGTTTTAMSIVDKLSPTSRVLYLDFDLVSPTADAWLRKAPMVDVQLYKQQGDLRSTSLGIFLEHGVEAVEHYIDRCIIPIVKTKGGQLDLFSGKYYQADEGKIATADFSALINLLGQRYVYIVADLGRLGNSSLNDSLIFEMSKISRKTIAVSTADYMDTRNMLLKMDNCKFDYSKVVWLLNQSATEKIDSRMESRLFEPRHINFAVLLEDSSIRGVRERFLKSRSNRDRFDLFLNRAVFS